LSVLEIDRVDLPRDERVDGYRVEGLHMAKRFQLDRHVADADRRRLHRHLECGRRFTRIADRMH